MPSKRSWRAALAVRRHTAQDGLHARQQFARLEGLGQVVVGAEFEADHAVHHVAARGEHDDRQLALLADGAAEFEAVHLGQHHVEDRGVEAAAAQQRQPGAGPGGVLQLEPGPREVRRQRRAEKFVVVDQQQARHVGIVLRR